MNPTRNLNSVTLRTAVKTCYSTYLLYDVDAAMNTLKLQSETGYLQLTTSFFNVIIGLTIMSETDKNWN